MRRIFLLLSVLVLLALLAAGAVGGLWFFGPYKNYDTETFVQIDHGMSSRAIADRLAAEGVVRSPWVFMAARILHPKAPLQAGEYRFAEPQTPWQVFDKIRRGEIFYEELTIPEGSNMFDIAALLDDMDTVDSQDFLKAAADASLIRDLDPAAPDLEGYLFPSTYRLTHKTTAVQLCREMIRQFRREWVAAGGDAQFTNAHHIVTIASLVEKETGVASERPLVAEVFENRLRLDMPLQCDPTTVYAALLENRYRGAIHRSDLASANPYNTYAHAGLPPGPIANPGRASLKAALHPANTAFLYFVAKPDGSGTHNFSASLDEHLKNVTAYRKTTRQ